VIIYSPPLGDIKVLSHTVGQNLRMGMGLPNLRVPTVNIASVPALAISSPRGWFLVTPQSALDSHARGTDWDGPPQAWDHRIHSPKSRDLTPLQCVLNLRDMTLQSSAATINSVHELNLHLPEFLHHEPNIWVNGICGFGMTRVVVRKGLHGSIKLIPDC
jgi:hypothetical protein